MTKRVGIIGLGQQAKELYLPAAENSAAVQIVGVLSTTPQNVQDTANQFGVSGYTSLDKMLDESSPDFVIATVPHDQYLPVLEAVAERGIHLLKGKPLARNLDEAQHIANIINASNIQVMITLPRRFNPLYIAAHEALPEIGAIFFSEFHSTLGLGQPADGWRSDIERAGGGCIIDMGYHMIDLLLWFQGQPDYVRAIYSSNGRPALNYSTEDTALVEYGFDAAYGVMVLSRIMPPRTEIVRFLGTTGTLEITGNELVIYDAEGAIKSQQAFGINKIDLARQQIEYFCGVLDGQQENVETADYNLQHMRVIDQCYRS